MSKNKSILTILNNKQPNLKESIDFQRYKELTDAAKITETDTHVYFENVPIAFGNTENKNKRVYDQESLKGAVEQYNKVRKNNPYFGYIFDGHSDEDTYQGIVGKIIKLQTDDDLKVVMGNFKINKGSHIYPLLENIIKDGDPVGVSMRILAPNSYKITKEELKNINDDILQLEDDDEHLAQMFSGNEVEYITGPAYIQRVDLTQFPSFNRAYTSKNTLKDESVNIKNIIQASCMMKEKYVCLTDTCKYRYTMKDFVDLINKDESIIAIKDHPELYDDIMTFAYFNMTDFNFNQIDDRKYLQSHIDSDDNISREYINRAITNVNNIVKDKSIFKYIKDNIDNIVIKDLVNKLYDTLVKLTESENIFYQVIIVNYIHQLILCWLLYNKVDTKEVNNIQDFISNLKLNENDKKYAEYLSQLMDNMEKSNDIYNVINYIFSFIYNIVDNFGDKLPPNTLLTETVNKLNDIKRTKIIFKKGKFVMAKKKKKCKKKKKK